MPGWHPTIAERADILRGVSRGGAEASVAAAGLDPADDRAVVAWSIANQGHGDSGFGANLIRLAETADIAAITGGLGAELGLGVAPEIIATDVLADSPAVVLEEEQPVDDWTDWTDYTMDDTGADVSTGTDWSLGDIDLSGAGGIIRSLGGGGGGGPVVTQAGAFGGAAAMGAGVALRSLWSVLRAGGGRIATFTINGVKGRMADLWPAVRKYGPGTVAVALGIGADQLASLLAQAPTSSRRRRQRGITPADIRRTRRVTGTLRRMNRQLGLGGGGRYRSSPRGRSRGRARWVRVDGY